MQQFLDSFMCQISYSNQLLYNSNDLLSVTVRICSLTSSVSNRLPSNSQV
jgi:hypothetical protein